MDAEFFAGCTAAKERLAAADAMRKTEPNYKLGWNAWTPKTPEEQSGAASVISDQGAPKASKTPPAAAPDQSVAAPAAPTQETTSGNSVADFSRPLYTVKDAILCPIDVLFDSSAEHSIDRIWDAFDTIFGSRIEAAKVVGCEAVKKGIRVYSTGTLVKHAQPSRTEDQLVSIGLDPSAGAMIYFTAADVLNLTNSPNGGH
jgi:hypothetical protein